MARVIFIGIILIILTCYPLRSGFAQETQEATNQLWSAKIVNFVEKVKQRAQVLLAKEIEEGVNYFKKKAQEKKERVGKSIKEEAREELNKYKESFLEQIKFRWGINKIKQGINWIGNFFKNLF